VEEFQNEHSKFNDGVHKTLRSTSKMISVLVETIKNNFNVKVDNLVEVTLSIYVPK
jgi:hypothetical protein